MNPSAPAPVTVAGRALDHPDRERIRLDQVLQALADPLRLSVLRRLAAAGPGAELSCSDFDLPVSKSTSTHHFRVLREAGLIAQTYRGTAKMNALRGADLEQLFPGLLDAVLAAAARERTR
jgi:DNA-binding transcriptional ArsR family regulator